MPPRRCRRGCCFPGAGASGPAPPLWLLLTCRPLAFRASCSLSPPFVAARVCFSHRLPLSLLTPTFIGFLSSFLFLLGSFLCPLSRAGNKTRWGWRWLRELLTLPGDVGVNLRRGCINAPLPRAPGSHASSSQVAHGAAAPHRPWPSRPGGAPAAGGEWGVTPVWPTDPRAWAKGVLAMTWWLSKAKATQTRADEAVLKGLHWKHWKLGC